MATVVVALALGFGFSRGEQTRRIDVAESLRMDAVGNGMGLDPAVVRPRASTAGDAEAAPAGLLVGLALVAAAAAAGKPPLLSWSLPSHLPVRRSVGAGIRRRGPPALLQD